MAVGRSAAALPWLCPNTESLIQLAEQPATLARTCPTDPALLAFLLRFVPAAPHPATGLFCPSSLVSSSLADAAAAFLATTPQVWIPPHAELMQRYQRLMQSAVPLARKLATITRQAVPDQAVAVVRLAPLGWLAVAAIDPGTAAEPLHDPESPAAPAIQQHVWGLDQNAIARRLTARWRLPDWITTTVGHLNLPVDAVRTVIADRGLFAVAQLALLEAERRGLALALTEGANRDDLLRELHLSSQQLEQFWRDETLRPTESSTGPSQSTPPHAVPLLRNLLKMAAESRRRNGAALIVRLEDRLDHLLDAVAQMGQEVERRAHDAKLAALAELAAGAGHEINNPLAIISGHAQRLFRTEPDPVRGEALQAIIRQSQRIASILRDLMQFARPPQPQPRRVALADLLTAVRDELQQDAHERHVRLDIRADTAMTCVRCDFAQTKHALAAVVRNAIEAAGENGWVRLRCCEADEDYVHLIVEDSGPGLSATDREHAFDPFYCGRSAGRKRGLGLPTAWQLIRQNGGDLRYQPAPDAPTRFLLTLPRSITLDFCDRQSA
ncbi:MAG: HAMP domain-containing sensor histidine kinase [Gemmataceae bacterium]|nr:HAMP domain-containing histidine kinase [Gemmata sp.]MDW8199312.1 HAMP domain-containing sensor histidine kinase [Gemmataceae bacterium]